MFNNCQTKNKFGLLKFSKVGLKKKPHFYKEILPKKELPELGTRIGKNVREPNEGKKNKKKPTSHCLFRIFRILDVE